MGKGGRLSKVPGWLGLVESRGSLGVVGCVECSGRMVGPWCILSSCSAQKGGALSSAKPGWHFSIPLGLQLTAAD